jgi:hypothetical protein
MSTSTSDYNAAVRKDVELLSKPRERQLEAKGTALSGWHCCQQWGDAII